MKIVTYCKSGFGWNLFLGVLASILMTPLGAYAASAAPAPKISAAPASVNFSSVKVGGSAQRTVTVKNTGTADLHVGLINIAGTDPTQFGQTNNCDAPVIPGGSCTVTVTFSPAAPFSKKSATMSIASNDPKKLTAVVKLSGQAPPPKISASPMSVTLTSPARTVTIQNTGISDLNISSVSIAGTNASDFSMTDSWKPVLAQGESTTVDVSFEPTSPGTKSASLQILSDDPKKSTVKVKLSGKPSTTFSTADLEGAWTISVLATGAGAQKWVHWTQNIAADGSATGTGVDSAGNIRTSSGTFMMSSDGKITQQGEPNMLCQMDAGKTFAACTDIPDAGIAQLGLFTKKRNSYEQADLEGTWHGNAVAAGTGGNWWARTDIIFAAGGAYTGTYSDSAGNAGPLSGAFNITTDGAITDLANHPNMLCSMDAGKTVVACTDTPIPGAVLVQVFTKQGNAYAVADLAGTWSGNSLATGPVAPWWSRAALTVKPDGTYTAQKTFNDGTSKSGSGQLLVDGNGVIKFSDDNNILCQPDASKTVFACTKTQKDGTSTELGILTRKLK